MRKDDLTEWLDERLHEAPFEDEMRAYVFQVLESFRHGGDRDLSDESIVLLYAKAIQSGDFESFQRVADWSLWVASYAPQSLSEPAVVEELGMRSYDACDRIMMRKWPVFGQLAVQLPNVVITVRKHVFR
jgi:hypothetical protein